MSTKSCSAHEPKPKVHYARRRPETSVLYQLVQENLETFYAQVQAERGEGLPAFVKKEFDAFLECGILSHGFVRARCGGCAHEKVVAFSWLLLRIPAPAALVNPFTSPRGFCPACGARRMAESAAHLVDHVIPHVPVRQWVLAFPMPLRLLFSAHPQALTRVLTVVNRTVSNFLIDKAGFRRGEAKGGAVTLMIYREIRTPRAQGCA